MPYSTVRKNKNHSTTFKFIGIDEKEGFENEEEK